MNKQHRVNVTFSDPIYGALSDLAETKNKSMAEVLRDAIALEKWFAETTKAGGRVLVERDGKTIEIVLR